jgi:putative NIF3 family GTP cyclohydrolase 1 type 2
MRISEILSRLEAWHAPLDPARRTVDGVIYGSADQECTGIVLTCCSMAGVIQEAGRLGANLIITHEPTFFSGNDATDWLETNKVYLAKKALLDASGMVIYRDHDHLHREKPDGIFSGVIKELGWEDYQQNQNFWPGIRFVMPVTTVREIARHMASVLRIPGMRILGDPDMRITKAAFCVHFLGNTDDRGGIAFMDESDCELFIPGEIIDWTFGQYIADSNALGLKKAVLNVGHFNWEEPGMRHMVKWLPDIIGHETPIHFVQSGNIYRWLSF